MNSRYAGTASSTARSNGHGTGSVAADDDPWAAPAR
jgi:hypothetical protein